MRNLILTFTFLFAYSFGDAVPNRKPPLGTHFVELDSAVYGRHLSPKGFDLPWYNTGIYIKKGTTYFITAQGSMSVSGNLDYKGKTHHFREFDPDGILFEGEGSYKLGQLRGRIKPKDVDLNYFNHFPIGKQFNTRSQQDDGMLELNMIPTRLFIGDDRATPKGKYQVFITIID